MRCEYHGWTMFNVHVIFLHFAFAALPKVCLWFDDTTAGQNEVKGSKRKRKTRAHKELCSSVRKTYNIVVYRHSCVVGTCMPKAVLRDVKNNENRFVYLSHNKRCILDTSRNDSFRRWDMFLILSLICFTTRLRISCFFLPIDRVYFWIHIDSVSIWINRSPIAYETTWTK